MSKRKTYRKRSRNRRRTRRRRKQRRRKTRKRRRRRRRRGGRLNNKNNSNNNNNNEDIFSPTLYEGIKRTIMHNRKVHLGILVTNLGKHHKRTEKYRSATNINDQVVAHARNMLSRHSIDDEQFNQVEREAMRADRDEAYNENKRRDAHNRAVAQEDAHARAALAVQHVGVAGGGGETNVARAMRKAAEKAAAATAAGANPFAAFAPQRRQRKPPQIDDSDSEDEKSDKKTKRKRR